MLSAALFDFDGTLVDTTELIYQSLRHASREVLGHEPTRETLMANVGQPLPQQMAALIETETDNAAETDGLVEELLESYRTQNEELHEDLIEEFPGVEEALARLKEAGVKIAVVTSKRHKSVEMAIETFPGLDNVANHFVTMEDTNEHKPKPEPLFKGLELLGDVPPEEAAYIGDSPHDIDAAHAAGVTSVAVSWGAFPEKFLKEKQPDYLVPDIDSAVDILLEKLVL
ncbi:HAD family hydrolase [soil metagenome]|jgi:pyrophosphatase PpaX